MFVAEQKIEDHEIYKETYPEQFLTVTDLHNNNFYSFIFIYLRWLNQMNQ